VNFKESMMTYEIIRKTVLSRLRQATGAFGLLVSIVAVPALGQRIHQLSYNNYNWTAQALARANTFVGNDVYLDDLGDIHGFEATISQ
jgi:hypothetical protein